MEIDSYKFSATLINNAIILILNVIWIKQLAHHEDYANYGTGWWMGKFSMNKFYPRISFFLFTFGGVFQKDVSERCWESK